MNATVARIVEIMFQETIMDEEVQALKDEVMNNCQERFQDMLDRGMTEDEAIAVVVESLKGMEEVIAQYPKKTGEHVCEDDDEDDEDSDLDLVFNASQVNAVKVLLTSDDVTVERSWDSMVHVLYNKEDMPNLEVTLNGGVLDIHRNNEFSVEKKEHINIEWNSFNDFMRSMKKALGNIQVNMCYGGGEEITIALPEERAFNLEVRTTSGEMDITGVKLSTLVIEDTTGDVSVDMDENITHLMKIKTTSGDVDVAGDVQDLTIQTVSGDAGYNGDCSTLTVSTVSGDADISGSMQDVMLKTVSGDMELNVKDAKLRRVDCKSTSGDLTIYLPKALQGQVAVDLKTVSGDKYDHFGGPVGTPLATVYAQTVSGDIELN